MSVTPLVGILLFFAGFFGGLIDSIAGGGGLITLPALLAVGLSPHQALGTNKFQSTFGSLTSSYNYVKHGGVNLRECVWGIVFTLIGAASGAQIVQMVNADFLRWTIPFLLLAILIYTVFSPDLGKHDSHPRWSSRVFYIVFGLSIGFYDGFFGPGTGSFWPVAMVLLLGLNLVKATGYTKVMNFTSNIVSLVVFTIGGQIVVIPGLCMGVGEIFGARLGAKLVIKKGVRFIRPVFIAVVLATTAKLFYDNLK
jgi:uncharacterized protein